jgi:hypothetical protein
LSTCGPLSADATAARAVRVTRQFMIAPEQLCYGETDEGAAKKGELI